MTFRSAAELAKDDDLMMPPAVLVPPVGITGRSTLLTIGPKGGKSTTVAGMIAEATQRGIKCGLLTLDEALPDSLQRLDRFGASLDQVYLDDTCVFATLQEDVARLGIEFLALDHLSKLAELSPDFGPNSQGDPVLWGRLVAQFASLARQHDVAVVLLDQARKADNTYGGSNAKAAGVDLLCELQPKDGGLVCRPKGRIVLPAFRVDLDDTGRPIFTENDGQQGRGAQRLNVATERDRMEVLAALQSAEPDGLRTTAWQTLAAERAGLGRTTFYELRRSLYAEGMVSYASRLYRITSAGARALEAWAPAA